MIAIPSTDRPSLRTAFVPSGNAPSAAHAAAIPGDRVSPGNAGAPRLAALRDAANAGSRGNHHHHDRSPGGPTILKTGAAQAAAIARGDHQIRIVDGLVLSEPSQRLDAIESNAPFEHGQTHVGVKHEAQTLESDVARLENEPHIPAAGGFRSGADAQYAVDETIANPANQQLIESLLADPSRYKDELMRVDLGRPVGDDVLRTDLDAGDPQLRPSNTAAVVVIKDPSFPEKYRVLTAYPEARLQPQVDAAGNPL